MQYKFTVLNSWGGTAETTLGVGPRPHSRSKKITHVLDRRIIRAYGNPDEVSQRLHEAAEGLIDARVDVEDTGTYDQSWNLVVRGWREMTPEELESVNEQRAEQQERQAEYERRQFERLRAEHPDWIREDL